MNATDNNDRRGGGATLAWLLGVSVAAHVAILGALGPHGERGAPARRRPLEVVVEVAPAPHVAPLAAAAPKSRAAPDRSVVRAPAAPPPSTPTPEEAPADFSGVTLTNDGAGPGWKSAVGNADAMRAPIGVPGTRVARAPVTRDAEPPLVALASLSRAPSPPDLADVLERHYPETARRQGLAGQAVLQARIPPDGHPRDLVLVSQSTLGFGDACRATLRDSVWTAPLDRDGRSVATLVTYTCRFEVR